MATILSVHREHPRTFEDFHFVYPVVSRRSRGLSIGLNVNPDKRCNFNCLYCQVDRSSVPAIDRFDLGAAEQELQTMLRVVKAGDLAKHRLFTGVPAAMLRLNDIALSGDGEPTLLSNFSEAIEMVTRHRPAGVKIVLISDGGGFGRAEVKRGLALMDAHDGEVWAKLDAGTEEYFKFINRTAVPFAQILRNITQCARARPIVIQSLFMKVYGHGPSAAEIAAYCDRLREIVDGGGKIKLVQICTVARRPMAIINGQPAWQAVTGLSDAEVDVIAETVRYGTGLSAESFYGA